ncbi:hypothetical protein HHK36_013307 [Tetracentron sinense]|uniref:Uncharacterized protein n=1 Tax=Tetracentron sinense TaxID=13715 RepID=A0A834ZC10_TETSI|nr:hypothetical protein HHK36_013307 [Tetracentron sinense]
MSSLSLCAPEMSLPALPTLETSGNPGGDNPPGIYKIRKKKEKKQLTNPLDRSFVNPIRRGLGLAKMVMALSAGSTTGRLIEGYSRAMYGLKEARKAAMETEMMRRSTSVGQGLH